MQHKTKRNRYGLLISLATMTATLGSACDLASYSKADGTNVLEERAEPQTQADHCDRVQSCCGPEEPLCDVDEPSKQEHALATAIEYGLSIDEACFGPQDGCGLSYAQAWHEPQSCKAAFGDRQLGESCEVVTSDPAIDDCVRGTRCTPIGVPPFSGAPWICIDPDAPRVGEVCTAAGSPGCGPNEYCDTSLADVEGICQATRELGAGCSPEGPYDQCGVGAGFCDSELEHPVCVAVRPAGQPCTGDVECASLICGEVDDEPPGIFTCHADLPNICDTGSFGD